MIPRLQIHGFRGFHDLEVPNLGALNLIVGENGVGKTTLLEAVSVYAAGLRGFDTICQVLSAREEVTGPGPRMRSPDLDPVAIERAFSPGHEAIIIDGGDAANRLEFMVGVVARETSSDGTAKERFIPRSGTIGEGVDRRIPAASIIVGTERAIVALDAGGRPPRVQRADVRIPSWFIGAEPHDSDVLADQWDRIALTARESDVVDVLRLLFDDAERLGFIQHIDSHGDPRRMPMIKRRGRDEPEPLQSLGAGARRLLSIGIGMASISGLVLIDEIENGIHHAALASVWARIAKTAQARKTQVFATTHSWDCVQAFQRAVAESGEPARLIRLRRRTGGSVEAIVVDEAMLATITRESVEVR